ncbi:flavin monoamine oxidase family protein [Hyalangium rubrum]|uniref:FAD-dependent oxidoreductase n=1 Tax=Hyalangium rubrum TaxID=3103134 RepID=A0ABU5HG77_9BACT|nr:FAD-dependent oxidoreductase [Hyalangium sp. s54d21]MDY7232458.1 FAD-dependent oxidoreductase [Hyalangium sp. s54d21]
MARTHLMNLVLRALRTARKASAAGVSVSEYAARQQGRAQFDRRTFLHLTGGMAGAAALTACGEDPEMESVAIVGGGMAGLHCAYRLQQLGVTARIYEASTRTGGRMFSARGVFPEGQHCELGGEFIDTGHETMHDLAQELEIELLDYNQDAPELARLVAYFDGHRLSEEEILNGFGPIAERIDVALGALADPEEYVTYRTPNGAEALDQLSLSAWMDGEGIPATNPVRRLIELAYVGEFGLDADECNCLNLLTFISTDATRLELFGESDERFHAKEGNDTFTQRLAERLEPGQIQLEHRLESLHALSDGRYRLSFSSPGGTREVKAEHVVLALPFTLLRQVDVRVELPAAKRKAIAELGYGTNAKLMVGFSSRPWRAAPHLSEGSTYSDTGYMQTWETSRLQPGSAGILTQYTGGQKGLALGEGTPEQQAAAFLEGFEAVFPGVKAAANGRVARMHWPSHPLTLGSYSAYKVGQFTTIAGAEIERVGNLHFCGEHTSLDAQGYMEGAALTGAMAATEVAEDLGLAEEARLGPGARILARARAARVHGRWLDAVRRSVRRRAG